MLVDMAIRTRDFILDIARDEPCSVAPVMESVLGMQRGTQVRVVDDWPNTAGRWCIAITWKDDCDCEHWDCVYFEELVLDRFPGIMAQMFG